MTDMTSGYLSAKQIDVMSGIVFNVMSGVKKLSNFVPAITCPTSANQPSFVEDSLAKVGQVIVSDLISWWSYYGIIVI